MLVSTVKVFIAQSCLTLCNPMACSLPGSSVPGILQARKLKWAFSHQFRPSPGQGALSFLCIRTTYLFSLSF